ncbi:MAG: pectinesterase family protein [Paludibacter sp.]|nr:pectinesterase family protein [Paludibacter sp.]
MKLKLLSFITFLVLSLHLLAEEKLLYSDTFQGWTAIAASATETAVSKTTDFSNETLTFKLMNVAVDPTKYDITRFSYPLVSTGAMVSSKMAAATDPCYIELSPLKSITKIYITEGATGSNRGFKVWKKADGDADWIAIYSNVASPAGGDSTTIAIPGSQTNVALKFTNLAYAQNAYLFDLKIYGDYSSTVQQVALTTGTNIVNAGTITKYPNSDTYDVNTTVKLTATKNFGYNFAKWVDENGVELSTENPYSIVLGANKTVSAVFDPVTTYNFTVTTQGSQWGSVTLTPAPVNGKYETGTIVSMTAVPNAVVNFLNWEDQTTGLSRSVQVDADKTFTASFDEIPFIVGWNFKVQTPTSDRSGDFFSETTNTGLFTVKNPDGTSMGWLPRMASFSPSYPCVQLWTPAVNFSTPRCFQASFSTVGYKNIQLKSMVSGTYHMYPVIQLQYSIDGINFTKLNEVNVTSAYGSAWADLNAVLPVDAEEQAKVTIRWIADTNSSPLLGNAVDVDGTAITNIYVYADKLLINDVTPPSLIATVPAAGATNASANGSIVLTFDEKLKVGTGVCSLGTTALTPSFGSKTITFAYSKLSYNTDYTFTIPAGALTDLSGNAFAGTIIHFKTMNRPQPIAKVFDAVIAKDGTGDFTTIQDAIDAAPAGATKPYLILVKNGTYTGHVDIPSTKPFIHLIGQFRDSVVIADNRLCGSTGDPAVTVYAIDPGATVCVKSADCYFENITFSNSYGYTAQAGPQALAVFTNNDRLIFKNCWMRSYQDTYMTGSGMAYRGYLTNCKIEGAVDFIYGQGDFFFDRCTIYCTRPAGGYIVAPNHPVGTKWGYVFSNSTLDGNAGVVTYLGRPWHAAPKTSFFNTTCKIGIYPVGWWYTMGGIPAVFADYNTMDMNGNPIDLSQRITEYQYTVTNTDGSTSIVKGTAKNSFTDAEAATYTYENVTAGTDSWDPKIKTEVTDAPLVSLAGSSVSWNAVDYAICYVVISNGKIVKTTTATSYQATSNGSVKVLAVSEYGALSVESNSVQVTSTAVNNTNASKLKLAQVDNSVEISNIPKNSIVKAFNFSGMMIFNKLNVSDNIHIQVNQNMMIQIKTQHGVEVFKVLKQ